MATQGRSFDSVMGVFKDPETDWIFNRTLTFMSEKAAEIGECLYAARRINEQDGKSWIREWAELASRVEAHAEEALAKGNIVSAREGYLRATNYYRTAEYGTPPSHTQFDALWEKSVDCFQQACKLFNPPIQLIQVPFEGKELPGYFWRPDDSGEKRPTLIAAGGNDSSLEEVVFWVGMAAVRHGYNFFTFEHPGHRGALHLFDDCFKRPDYEVPYKAGIDYLETLPGTDERIAMTGYSFGGYVTCRVAAHEKRLKAIVPNPPIIDAYQLFSTDMRDSTVVKVLPTAIFESLAERGLSKSPMRYNLAKYTMMSFGTPELSWTEFAKFEAQRPFTVRDELHQITCPTLALVGGGEGYEMLNQSQQFVDDIAAEKKRQHVFTLEQDGANDHCQLDNRARSTQVMFDWLNEVFDYRYE
ncbi:MAG: alpha/beta hydrolase [Chloroflexi bacterium]|nr:MAG: alpha/beta hydrolase [Chloroflexota bacterium]MBL1197245.1 alpha/beta hydrolase [Chloroflexota bacterium]NOH14538.1 alpha/beta hydrolase [Chloroflexota bacterium]